MARGSILLMFYTYYTYGALLCCEDMSNIISAGNMLEVFKIFANFQKFSLKVDQLFTNTERT